MSAGQGAALAAGRRESDARMRPLRFRASLLRLADPRITLASVSSLALGTAWAAREGPLHPGWLALTVLGVLCVEVAKNASGEVYDFDSGADTRVAPEDRSPFSGGKRVPVEGLLTRGQTWAIAAWGYALAIGAGLAIAAFREPGALGLGVVGLACAWFYHAPPLRLSYRGLGELAVGICYGPLVAGGAGLVQLGRLPPGLLLASLPLGMLIAAFLWVNELPDCRADRAAGKRTLVARLGRPRAARAFTALVAAAFALLACLPLLGAPAGVLWGMAGLPLGAAAVLRVLRHPEDTARVVPAQAWTLAAFVLYTLGASAGLLLR